MSRSTSKTPFSDLAQVAFSWLGPGFSTPVLQERAPFGDDLPVVSLELMTPK